MDRDKELNYSNEINAIDFEFYKTLFDPVRIEIIRYLAVYGERNITTIAENLPQDRSVISKHLDLMYRFEIVSKTRVGRNIYYEVNSQMIFNKFKLTTDQLEKLLQ
ncbi:ArsR/SmtB family transcription factor [Priestia taiwanensis]|uniref:Transcriptional regulator n=1 Tax=Priestia taiwanensis TaxID=1347902 RepID=A0A917APJ6_9BACI|nr:metalloregulator ArsR/SmtB family transcription factor [Priestia taiwanensis]MBM7362750.1 DNA-binding transcriptional ArsR family regulator [Priestia taiwanensis]GGE64774.1 transcriptional regulator [Priestia taiwanensis]